jgi:hypothetical protein
MFPGLRFCCGLDVLISFSLQCEISVWWCCSGARRHAGAMEGEFLQCHVTSPSWQVLRLCLCSCRASRAAGEFPVVKFSVDTCVMLWWCWGDAALCRLGLCPSFAAPCESVAGLVRLCAAHSRVCCWSAASPNWRLRINFGKTIRLRISVSFLFLGLELRWRQILLDFKFGGYNCETITYKATNYKASWLLHAMCLVNLG